MIVNPNPVFPGGCMRSARPQRVRALNLLLLAWAYTRPRECELTNKKTALGFYKKACAPRHGVEAALLRGTGRRARWAPRTKNAWITTSSPRRCPRARAPVPSQRE